MLVARTLPLQPFAAFRSEMERLMDEAFETARPTARPMAVSRGASPSTFPPINAWQDDAAVHVEAELPGFKPEEVEISFEHETLSIRGRREPRTAPETGSLLRRERSSTEFERTVRFGLPIDPAQIKASLVNGILTVTLPKHAAAQPRKISITQV